MDWGALLGSADKAATVAGVLIGGAWVYFNSFRGRVFVPRLQVELTGKLLPTHRPQYVLATMQVKNVGTSIVQLKARGTGLKITSLFANPGSAGAPSLAKGEPTAYPVLEKHAVSDSAAATTRQLRAIEPGTTICEQKLLTIPNDQAIAFQLELRVAAVSGFRGRRDRAWRAVAIATHGTPTH
jgi:hypothetical protein